MFDPPHRPIRIDSFGAIRSTEGTGPTRVKGHESMNTNHQKPMSHEGQVFPGELDSLGALRDFVREFCAQTPAAELPRRWMFQLELALNEAASNIIRHALCDAATPHFELQLSEYPEWLRVRLVHAGRGFDREAVPPPVCDGSQTGGFGVFLIDQCVDCVDYRSDGNGTHLVELIKRFDADLSDASEQAATP